MQASELWSALLGRNVSRAVVSFWGGGDEGGVDGIRLYGFDGTSYTTLDPFESYGWGERIMTADQRLAAALGAPALEQYGGYGGEGTVSGNLIYDVTAREVSWETEWDYDTYNDEGEEW